ncbi:curli-like amyloid fiber formation chaperone CsgH [uncultured Pontibacter sp.]|uniref:curli-like amyloid fiber formation chaperone CsgH n=1 Tax=uncultured Pontibacter sp. TaxID=453356 RepID=UPI002613E0F4|nr:curli-like amyloid fiber formation chaperone CsgH [uncultured Pontibacter sp.]
MYDVNYMTQTESQYVAQMDTQRENGLLLVSNMFENNSQQTVYLTYKFRCIRVSATGKSANSQSGSFVAASGQTISLSKTALSIRPTDSYDLLLEIYDGNQLVAKQELKVPEL